MAARTRTAPPPTPARNHTGVVLRWRSWAGTCGALAFGWVAGRYGLGTAAAALAWMAIVVVVAIGVTLELRRQARSTEFVHIERRRQVARALRGDHDAR